MKKDYEIAKGAGRLVEVPASLIRTYMNLASAFQKEGKPVIKFSAGEPNFNTPSDIKEAAIRAITNNQTHYTSNKGYDPMRKAISAYMKEFFEVDYDYDKEILVTSSAAEALNNTMFAFVDDGDEVIIPTPSFVTYKALTSMCGAKIVNLPLKPEDSFQIDLAKLKASITDKTKMLILNNPCNPTGAVIPYETLKVICELAVEYNFLVLSDEIYGRLVYGNNKFYSVASFPGMKERTILVSGFSKTFAMTGWKPARTPSRRKVSTAYQSRPLIFTKSQMMSHVRNSGISRLMPARPQITISRTIARIRTTDSVIETWSHFSSLFISTPFYTISINNLLMIIKKLSCCYASCRELFPHSCDHLSDALKALADIFLGCGVGEPDEGVCIFPEPDRRNGSYILLLKELPREFCSF